MLQHLFGSGFQPTTWKRGGMCLLSYKFITISLDKMNFCDIMPPMSKYKRYTAVTSTPWQSPDPYADIVQDEADGWAAETAERKRLVLADPLSDSAFTDFLCDGCGFAILGVYASIGGNWVPFVPAKVYHMACVPKVPCSEPKSEPGLTVDEIGEQRAHGISWEEWVAETGYPFPARESRTRQVVIYSPCQILLLKEEDMSVKSQNVYKVTLSNEYTWTVLAESVGQAYTKAKAKVLVEDAHYTEKLEIQSVVFLGEVDA